MLHLAMLVPAIVFSVVVEDAPRLDAERRIVRMPAASVTAAYESLLAVDATKRAELIAEYPSTLRSALWQHHLSSALTRHPEFTPEQRRVVMLAKTLLTPRFFELEESDAEWATVVGEPLRQLTAEAQRVFPPALARELFVDMGPPESTETSACDDPYHDYIRGERPISRLQTNDLPTCTCSTTSDYCDWSGVGFYYCRGGGCYWKSRGCGTFGMYACTGLCAQRGG